MVGEVGRVRIILGPVFGRERERERGREREREKERACVCEGGREDKGEVVVTSSGGRVPTSTS